MSDWKETVRNIYDVCHFGQPTPLVIIEMIEARHPDYFVDVHEPAVTAPRAPAKRIDDGREE